MTQWESNSSWLSHITVYPACQPQWLSSKARCSFDPRQCAKWHCGTELLELTDVTI